MPEPVIPCPFQSLRSPMIVTSRLHLSFPDPGIRMKGAREAAHVPHERLTILAANECMFPSIVYNGRRTSPGLPDIATASSRWIETRLVGGYICWTALPHADERLSSVRRSLGGRKTPSLLTLLRAPHTGYPFRPAIPLSRSIPPLQTIPSDVSVGLRTFPSADHHPAG